MNRKLKTMLAWLLSAGALLSAVASGAEPGAWPVGLHPAVSAAHADRASMLATAWAGTRVVAVGAHGIVLLSDDQGKHWRQAGKVPLDVTLTGVSFANDQEGWAVGHAGAILHTRDGGEQWEIQRCLPEQDRPLFGVHFFDAEHGVAVGLWSLVLTTSDGGRQWTARQLDAPPGAKRADLNLLGLFAGPNGALYAAAEKGYVLHSADKGLSWNYLATGFKGSFWAGTALQNGGLLVGGLRGALYRSGDAGQNWVRIDTGSTVSISSVVRTDGGRGVLAVGQDGLTARSTDDGVSLQVSYREDRLSLYAALPNAGFTPPLMSARGPSH
ncbi:MAG: YCF48-related protein [Pseudomonadota bacterium]